MLRPVLLVYLLISKLILPSQVCEIEFLGNLLPFS